MGKECKCAPTVINGMNNLYFKVTKLIRRSIKSIYSYTYLMIFISLYPLLYIYNSHIWYNGNYPNKRTSVCPSLYCVLIFFHLFAQWASLRIPVLELHFVYHAEHAIITWRHNGPYGVPNHQPHDCLLNRLFRRRSKKTSNLRVTGLCAVSDCVPVVTEKSVLYQCQFKGTCK